MHSSFDSRRIAADSLERYSGSHIDQWQPRLLLTNFPAYIQEFARQTGSTTTRGSAFQVAHSPERKISMLNFGLGSPSAALVVDLIAHLHCECVLLLGMCGGLRRRYQVGDYLIPMASIRGEGTSDFYSPPEVPALANFHMTQSCAEVLGRSSDTFHFGITHTTNIRFWEFDERFRQRLTEYRAQAIEMECATLFCAGYRRGVTTGALLLISDLPLGKEGIKTKDSAKRVIDLFARAHIERGIEVVEHATQLIQSHRERKRAPRTLSPFHYQPLPLGENSDLEFED